MIFAFWRFKGFKVFVSFAREFKALFMDQEWSTILTNELEVGEWRAELKNKNQKKVHQTLTKC